MSGDAGRAASGSGAESEQPKDSGYGWNGFGDYFDQKKQKLFEQNEELRGTAASKILKDVVLYIDGLTQPPAHELKKIVLNHGGYVNQYPKKTTMWVGVGSSKFLLAS